MSGEATHIQVAALRGGNDGLRKSLHDFTFPPLHNYEV